MQVPFGKSLATMALLLSASLPAAAQFNVRVDIPLPALEIRVGHRAPPPLPREVRSHRPGRDFLWVQGSWDWQRDDWAWIPGRWERPGYRNARWLRARYVRQGQAWRYEPAHWSNQGIFEGPDYQRWRETYDNDRGHGRHGSHDDGHGPN